ncbi:phage late control D family protein [Marinibactrum halimedae]|uniref:Phage late control D family protein n=1 Tax=Marinibactrum halimedae TaxID=1444977 RepID=A0AA37T9L6_9GAMM|nr:contractile injection system protein, VgrG/Pvc8 family [Marinibactrum halimedae]MCD9460789.1 hypothetical protein [Marinibactrum halimedae]GLS27377.1 hypothetical protein GCM10007877_30960 [Marinibactrum halimedae]
MVVPLNIPARLSRLTAPAFSIRVNGLPASPAFIDRLVSINVVLNNGEVSDQLSLVFDDRETFWGRDIAIPSQGVNLSVSLGYQALTSEMGDFIVNQVHASGSGGGRTLSVTATPTLLSGESMLTWGDESLSTIVSDIAKKYDLIAKVSAKLANRKLPVVHQCNESDSAFLTRLAQRFNAFVKPMAGNLLFMTRGEGSSASGLPMLPVVIPAQDVLSWSKTLSEQHDFTKVGARWSDFQSGIEQEVYMPPQKPQKNEMILRDSIIYNNQAEAEAAAEAKFKEVNRDNEKIQLTVLGNPHITAEGKILVDGLRSGANGTYIVERVTHSFSQGGFQSQIQAYVEPVANGLNI